MTDQSKFTHVHTEKPTKKKIVLLARVRGRVIYELMADWANENWEKAKQQGLVTDKMLAHVVGKDGVVEISKPKASVKEKAA